MASNPYEGGSPVLDGLADGGETDGEATNDLTGNPIIATWTNDLTVPLEVYAEIRLGGTTDLASAVTVFTVTLQVTPSGGAAYQSITSFSKETGQTEAFEMTRGIMVPAAAVLVVKVDSDIANTASHWCRLLPTPASLPLGVVIFKTTATGDTTSILSSGLTAYADDVFIGRRVVVLDGTYKGLAPYVTDFDGTSDPADLTVSTMPAAVHSTGETCKLV